MRALAFDTETHLFKPGAMAPRIVCASFATQCESFVLHRDDPRCKQHLEASLRDPEVLFVGQFVAYDFAVIAAQWPDLLPAIFAAYDSDRVADTKLREKLARIAEGSHGPERRYDLASLAKVYGYPVDLDKDTWRLRYAEFDSLPVSQWPAGAVEYSEHDALATLFVYESQAAAHPAAVFLDEHRQARADFALHLCSVWGIHTDPRAIDALEAKVRARLDAHERSLVTAGLVYADKKGVLHKRSKLAGERAAKLWAERGGVPSEYATPKGAPSLDADAVAALGDPTLIALQEWSSAGTALARVEELREGVTHPIHTRFDALMATGRTSSSKPNIQNRPTEVGDRECFVPRPGTVFLDADFDGLELRTVAQVVLFAGFHSKLGEALNANADPHSMVAARILGISDEEAKRRKADKTDHAFYLARQAGKIANFGLAGGLGKGALIKQARAKYGVELDETSAAKLVAAWHATWPEFRGYFAWIRSQCGAVGRAFITHFLSERQRGGIPYTEACNTFFQGLGADVAKASLWALTREFYVGNGPLRGARLVNFVHDQFIAEVPDDDRLDERVAAFERTIIEAANVWLPDVPVTTQAVACRRWSKLAERVTDSATGRVVPWEWSDAP
jgi:DNA polymerase-1